jgi:hypothetical protein
MSVALLITVASLEVEAKRTFLGDRNFKVK